MSAAFVADKRRLGASWGTVARMLGRSEHDTRREFDPTYAPDLPWFDRHARRAAAETPKPERRPPSPTLRPLDRHGAAARALAAICDGARTAGGVGRAVGRPARNATGLTRILERRGLIAVTPTDGRALNYTPTDLGRDERARLDLDPRAEAA